MAKNHDPRLKKSAIRARYNDPTKFSEIDRWHLFTATTIQHEIARYWDLISTSSDHVILNAGAGGKDIGPSACTTINLDISETRLVSLSHPLLASVETLPLADCCVDTIICVGSVINYCDAAAVILEFQRVLRPGGYLILEFESSYSAELITQDSFGKPVGIAETFYAHQKEVVWVYSPKYIKNLLKAAKFKYKHGVPIHLLSPWALLLFRSNRAAAAIARLDPIARKIPFLSHWASNHLFFCEKRI